MSEVVRMTDAEKEALKKLFEDTSRALWEIRSVVGKNEEKTKERNLRIVLPRQRKKKRGVKQTRYSEPEARFLFCGLLNSSDHFYYSVETPTLDVSGKGRRSGNSDLSLYKLNGNDFYKITNVEFKAHNAPVDHIAKDIEKLVREEVDGAWFHVLKSTRTNTIPELCKKFEETLLEQIIHL